MIYHYVNQIVYKLTGWNLIQYWRFLQGKSTKWFICKNCCQPYWQGEQCPNENCEDGWLSQMILFNQQANEIRVYHKGNEVGVIDYLKDRGWFLMPNGHTIYHEVSEEITEFLCSGEKMWLTDQILKLNSDWDWWGKPNDKFGGKTPNEQLEEDTSPIWDMYIRLAHGMIM